MNQRLIDFRTLDHLSGLPGPILFVFPPFHRLMREQTQWIPLGLSSLASALSYLGAKCTLYNADCTPNIHQTEEKRLSCLERYQNAKYYDDAFSGDEHPVWAEIEGVIRDVSPWMVAVSVLSENVRSAYRICEIAKSISRNIVTVCGGPHITLSGVESGASHHVDYQVRGEGEFALASLVSEIHRRKASSRVHTAPGLLDLDSLPSINDDLLYRPADYPFLFMRRMVSTSRGCPGACGFCSAPQLWTRKVRRRTLEPILVELEDKIARGTKKVFFVDDTFASSRRQALSLCNGFLERNLHFSWTCTTRAGTMTTDLLHVMKQAGCKSIHLGVESGSERILKLVDKQVHLEEIERTAKMVKNAGIHLAVFFMFGIPSETKEDIKLSMRLAQSLGADEILLHPFVPIVGTPLFEHAKEQGLLTEELAWTTYTRNRLFYQFFDGMSKSDVDELVTQFYRLAG